MDERGEQTHDALSTNRVVVTAVVATFNEERHIATCLQNLLSQRGLPGELEIIVVDGMSRDRTAAIVQSFPEYGTTIKLIQNHRRLQTYAWNLALREMRGSYFAMITAHAEYAPDYLATCLETMRRTGATAVGGVPRAYGEGVLGRAIAWCMSSPFGVGGARFRYMEREQECDTVPLIFTRRETIEQAGGYDERIAFDEDSELNYRLRQRGARFIVTPAAGVRYHVRQSLRALSKQMYRYGYWRRLTQLMHPRSVPLRIMAPPALLAALALSLAVAATPLRLLALAVPLLYLGFLAMATLRAVLKIGAPGLLVPVALSVMHVSYGWGWWSGLVAFRSRVEPRLERTFAR